jgi:hypothetical protein
MMTLPRISLVLRRRLSAKRSRAPFHFFSRERRVDCSAVPVRSVDRVGGYKNFALVKPAAGVDYDITHRPLPVIEVKSLDSADITIGGTDRKIFELVRASQHDFALPAEIPQLLSGVEQGECHDGS